MNAAGGSAARDVLRNCDVMTFDKQSNGVESQL